ncbi:hypothetical protein WLX09_25150, partial [Bordetella bronchiseptica]
MNAPRCLRRLLERQWRQGGWLSTLLRPLAALTGLVVARKRNVHQHTVEENLITAWHFRKPKGNFKA